MSYSIHITRAQYTWESEDNPITLEEWVTLVNSDPEMKIINELEGINPLNQEKIVIKLENSAVWIYEYDGQVCEIPFVYHSGRISVSAGHDKVIEKMKELAGKISCRVVGDEGEEY